VLGGVVAVVVVAAAADPAVGQQLPALSGIGLDERPIAIGPDDGPWATVVLAHRCPHCQTELPRLAPLVAPGCVPEGVTVVGVSTQSMRCGPTTRRRRSSARSWAQLTLIDDASSGALEALGLSSYPGFVFVDAQGAVTFAPHRRDRPGPIRSSSRRSPRDVCATVVRAALGSRPPGRVNRSGRPGRDPWPAARGQCPVQRAMTTVVVACVATRSDTLPWTRRSTAFNPRLPMTMVS
jgi:hypothetical protein